MAPPELAADAPVAQVVDPVEIGVFPIFWDQFQCRLLRQLHASFSRKTGHRDKPLFGHIGLDNGFRAVGEADAIEMRFNFFYKSKLLSSPRRRLRAPLPSSTLQNAAIFIDLAIGRHDVDEGEFVR